MQYFSRWQRETISKLIGEAIQDADKKGAKVLSLGLLNQVVTLQEDEYKKLLKFDNKLQSNLILSKRYDVKEWLVGDGVTDKESPRPQKEHYSFHFPYSHQRKFARIATIIIHQLWRLLNL
ncbi:hypothetical protein PTKIN_Ptkin11bG0058800 [Pterospermum kingtungense]